VQNSFSLKKKNQKTKNFLKNLKQQMLPENKLGCFQCSKIVPRVKDNIKIPYFLLKCNPIAKEPFGVNKQGSFSTKVKESFENNRTASCAAATEAPYLIKSNIHQWNKNLFAQLKCLYF